MTERSSRPVLNVLLCGRPDFTAQLSRGLLSGKTRVRLASCVPQDAWKKVLEEKPDFLVCGFGHDLNFEGLETYRHLFTETRERFGLRIQNIVALLAPQTLFFGGDLLFAEDTLEESGLIDGFLASAPIFQQRFKSLSEQLLQILELETEKRLREPDVEKRLPPLNTGGWVPSLADPESRELWYRWLPRYASYTNENPLIIGETGTGKTNLARSLHRLSGREGDFISITPRDFSSSELVQAELFGAVSGAYTGAVDKWGLVKSAERGTLFIDELQSIDKDLQGKLITFIENKAYRRVGSSDSVTADVRFVFASNRQLLQMMDDETLRDDFAYRLGRVVLHLTPLASRPLDIIPAIAFSLAKVFRQRPIARPVIGIAPESLSLLLACDWPGNLRQLENCIAQLCELSDISKNSVIRRQHVAQILESQLYGKRGNSSELYADIALRLHGRFLKNPPQSLGESVRSLEEEAVQAALNLSGGRTEEAQAILSKDSAAMELLLHSLNSPSEDV